MLTRRAPGSDGPFDPTITLGGVAISILTRQVRVGKEVIRLSGIELSLLYVLASRAGQAVSHAQLMEAVWGPDFAGERTVIDRHVRNLRVKLRNDHPDPRFITAVPGQGYCFTPSVAKPGR